MQLETLAHDVGADPATIRRAVQLGLIHARRPSPRKVEISVGERVYVRSNWSLLSDLRMMLRPEHNVVVAVLYGSVARGSHHDMSDIDVAVLLKDPSARKRLDLQRRMTEKIGRSVQVVDLRDARDSETLWRHVTRDGRVLANRGDGDWRKLRVRRGR